MFRIHFSRVFLKFFSCKDKHEMIPILIELSIRPKQLNYLLCPKIIKWSFFIYTVKIKEILFILTHNTYFV